MPTPNFFEVENLALKPGGLPHCHQATGQATGRLQILQAELRGRGQGRTPKDLHCLLHAAGRSSWRIGPWTARKLLTPGGKS